MVTIALLFINYMGATESPKLTTGRGRIEGFCFWQFSDAQWPGLEFKKTKCVLGSWAAIESWILSLAQSESTGSDLLVSLHFGPNFSPGSKRLTFDFWVGQLSKRPLSVIGIKKIPIPG